MDIAGLSKPKDYNVLYILVSEQFPITSCWNGAKIES